MLETPAGAVYHVPLPARAVDGLEPGALVTLSATRREPEARPIDRNVARERVTGDPKPPRYRLSVEPMELSLAGQVACRRPVWFDRVDPRTLSTHGLGAEVSKAIEQRRQVLGALGLTSLIQVSRPQVSGSSAGSVGEER